MSYEPPIRDPRHDEDYYREKAEGDCPAATCSLGDAETGKQMAVLPHFTPIPLPVEVDEWHQGGKLAEKTVRLLQGTLKGEFLSDEQLEGAQFLGRCSYPANGRR